MLITRIYHSPASKGTNRFRNSYLHTPEVITKAIYMQVLMRISITPYCDTPGWNQPSAAGGRRLKREQSQPASRRYPNTVSAVDMCDGWMPGRREQRADGFD